MHRWVVVAVALSLGLAFQHRPVLSSEPGDPSLDCRSSETPSLLKSAAEAVTARLQALDRDLAGAARSLSGMDLASDGARAVIRRVQEKNGDTVIDTSTISAEGVMLQVEPHQYGSAEGADISDQEQIKTLIRTRKPVMSRVFRTVEGVAAVDMEHPVIGTDGRYRGSVSAIFQPWVLIQTCVRHLVEGMPVEIWAMQPDGAIIYDADPEEVGRLLFSDPGYKEFPSLLKLGRRIANEPQGCGYYSYFKAETREVVRKDAWWVSVTHHSAVWRLVSVHPSAKAGTAIPADTRPFSREALRALARDTGLIKALVRGDEETAMEHMREAAMGRPGIYSISFVDASAVNRFGYPRQNSLFDVDLSRQTDPASVAIVTAVSHQKELVYTGPLVEGGQASYFLTPVLDGRTFIGSLLWIQKE